MQWVCWWYALGIAKAYVNKRNKEAQSSLQFHSLNIPSLHLHLRPKYIYTCLHHQSDIYITIIIITINALAINTFSPPFPETPMTSQKKTAKKMLIYSLERTYLIPKRHV